MKKKNTDDLQHELSAAPNLTGFHNNHYPFCDKFSTAMQILRETFFICKELRTADALHPIMDKIHFQTNENN